MGFFLLHLVWVSSCLFLLRLIWVSSCLFLIRLISPICLPSSCFFFVWSGFLPSGLFSFFVWFGFLPSSFMELESVMLNLAHQNRVSCTQDVSLLNNQIVWILVLFWRKKNPNAYDQTLSPLQSQTPLAIAHYHLYSIFINDSHTHTHTHTLSLSLSLSQKIQSI